MQPVYADQALKKETMMDSNPVGLAALFIGPRGLRAAWRLLIFLLMLVAMGAGARAIIIRFLIPAGFAPEKFTPSSVAVQDAFFIFIVAVAAWVMSKIEGRKIGQYGLPLQPGLTKHLWLVYGSDFSPAAQPCSSFTCCMAFRSRALPFMARRF